jgi:hypothetical protein
MYERPWPDIEGTPSREGSPHPLVVLALARILATRFWRGSRVQVDRDVTAWALWTYCQVPKTGRRGRSYRLDLGAGMTERVTPELIGLAAATDVLSVVAFAPRTIQRAIQRIGDFLDDVLRMTAPHGLVAPK